MQWFDQGIPDVAAELKSDPERGLAAEEARRRLAEHGPNELTEIGDSDLNSAQSGTVTLIRDAAQSGTVTLIRGA